MKKLSCLLVLSGLVSVPALAADAPASPHTVAFNVGATTDYVFRGISQSQHDPAISGGVDYSHASGLYAGTWVSTQKWVETTPYKTSSDFEWDVYGGYKGSLGDIGYDVGLIHYAYDGDRNGLSAPTPETTEAYIGVSYKEFSAKYSHAISPYFIGWGTRGTAKSKNSNYLEVNWAHDLGDGWGVLAHLGHQIVKNEAPFDADYTDWKIGVTKDVGFGVVTLAYTDTNADKATYTWGTDAEKVAKGVLALSFAKSF